MDKLLKEAIADAKAVRETALANAKIALEEAFTPHLKSMLSKKLQAEMEGDDEEADIEAEIEEPAEEEPEAELEEDCEDDSEEGLEEDAEEEEQPAEDDSEEELEEDEDEEDIDLEEALRQLEEEMEDEDTPAAEEDELEEDEDEEIDLDEIIRTLTEEDEDEEFEFEIEEDEDEDEDVEDVEVAESLRSELKEYKGTVQYLRDKLSEVNLLNAKLLYTNKLFRSRSITETQKMKVIEQFDRAANVREVKLVYTTFAESMKRKAVNESISRKGQASKQITSTKSKKPIIGEQVQFKTRMKKLANII
jgi:hypothetical protein